MMKTVPYQLSDRIMSVHFDGMSDLIDFDIRSIPNITKDSISRFNDLIRGVVRKQDEWYGPTNKNNRQVIEHALLGDHELYKLLVDMVTQIDDETGVRTLTYRESITKPRRVRKFDSFGDELDIHKVYQGKCDSAWERRIRVPSNETHNLVTIYVDIGGLAVEDAKLSLWRAAAVVKLVRDYEAAGKSIRVIVGGAAFRVYTRTSHLATHSIVVKNYNERLSLERLAAMSHLGFHRTFGFAARLCQPFAVHKNYGHTTPLTQTCLSLGVQAEIAEGKTKVVIVPRCTSLSSAINSINRVYDDLKNIVESRRHEMA